jgi:hypothetical protein
VQLLPFRASTGIETAAVAMYASTGIEIIATDSEAVAMKGIY